MAFLWTDIESKERFSLLLLEPGEIYFDDFSATLFPLNCSENESMQRSQKGRFKICSKSIVFEPKDIQYPILKIPYVDILNVDRWTGSLFSKLGTSGKCLMVEAKQVVEMKCNNSIVPYQFRKTRQSLMFCLSHSSIDDCLPHVCQLHRASALPHADQSAMIAAIVMSRQCRQKFDTSRLDDLFETIVKEVISDHITALVTNPGRLMLTSSRLYFQPFNNATTLLKIRLSDIRRIIRRRFLLHNQGLEIYCNENSRSSQPHLYMCLRSPLERDEFYQLLLEQKEVKIDDLRQENITLQWQNRLISNYDYLKYLNSEADRSVNDLTQYPIYPWVVSDYSSQELDLSNERSFRDLSKPIGALCDERLSRLRERYADMPEPKFLYGSHYSTPAHVLYYLARAAPQYMLCLQNGRFDHPDRMFNSVSRAFHNCLTSMSDFKELIPEFYDSSGDFLKNVHMIDFGRQHDGHRVHDVELPPWAKCTTLLAALGHYVLLLLLLSYHLLCVVAPQDFVHKMRAALESDYVSRHLHEWIDLIFGYKQRGSEAELADNVFVHLTYEGSVDLDSITNANERASLVTQIMEFGQTPKQLFTSAHPQRCARVTSPVHQVASLTDGDSVMKQSVVSYRQCVEHLLHRQSVLDVKLSSDGQQILSSSQDGTLKLFAITDCIQLHSCNPSAMPMSSIVLLADGKTVVAGSWDNNIYTYSLEYGRTLNASLAHDDAVSRLSMNGELLVSSSWDSTVKLWTCAGNKLDIKAELEHDTGVICVDQNSNNSQLISGASDGCVYLWDPEYLHVQSKRQAHLQSTTAVHFSPDNQRLVSCGRDGFLKIFDISTECEIFAKKFNVQLTCAQWRDKYVIVGCDDGYILTLDCVLGEIVNSLAAHTGSVGCIDVLTDLTLCSGGSDNCVRTWDCLR